MSKIAFLADIHLGVESRTDDIFWALEVAREYCAGNDIDVVGILGDLFHDRHAVPIDIMCRIYDFFKVTKYEYKQQWFTFPGNHDMFNKYSWSINSLQTLSDVLTVFDSVKLLEIGGQRFWILPFVYSESAYMQILEVLESKKKSTDILLTHIGICGAELNICFLLQNWNIVNFRNSTFNKVYTGHYHIPQTIGCVQYIGSIIPYKIDEGDCSHGFVVHDTYTDSHKFIDIWEAASLVGDTRVPAPQYNTFHDTLLDDKSEREVSNNIIRVALTRDYGNSELDTIRDRLLQLGARRVSFMNICEEPKFEHIKYQKSLRHDQLFSTWLEHDRSRANKLQTELLVKLDLEIRQEGDERYLSKLETMA